MKFRPCIDIHNGKVKQIIGGSLKDSGDQADENFVSELDGTYYGQLYKQHQLTGGHIIILNPASSPHYESDVAQALKALSAFPGGLQVGGGINCDNAAFFLEKGASHVIVTSYVFKDGKINWNNLKNLSRLVTPEKLVLDLSCRRRDDNYYIVTDRWQKFTDVILTHETLDTLAPYCNEFLVHAVDVEGHAKGIEVPLARLLASWKDFPITYAGGIGSMDDINQLRQSTNARLDYTVGSALDLFGGPIRFNDII